MNWPWARDALAYGLVAALSVYCAITGGMLIGAIALLLMGIAQHALGNLVHEGLHGQVHRSRRVNECLTRVAAWPLGMRVGMWRYWHARHHAHTGNPMRDPEVTLKRRRAPRWYHGDQWVPDLLGLSADEMPAFWLSVHHADFLRSAAYSASFLLVLGLMDWRAPFFWVGAMLTTQTMFFRMRCKAEHEFDDLKRTIRHESKPSLLARLTYLPCRSWDHYAHHHSPAARMA